MDTEVDLTTVDRDVLIAIIAELQAVIERLQRRIAELKAKSARKPPAQQGPRNRRHGFARPRMTPTPGGARDGELSLRRPPVRRLDPPHSGVIELPVVPAQVTEHVYIARTCPACRRRCTPPAELDGVVLGQQRLGVNRLSLIATLREEGRLPIASSGIWTPCISWPQRGGHRERHPYGAAGPTGSGRDPGHPRQPSGAYGYVGTFSTPNATSCGGVS